MAHGRQEGGTFPHTQSHHASVRTPWRAAQDAAVRRRQTQSALFPSAARFSGRGEVGGAVLFVSAVNDTGRALHFIVAVLHFLPPPHTPPTTTTTTSLLRGLRMNSHCHVQGRVAQGQLIAFMIMISRQIYRARSQHIFQVLPVLAQAWGGGRGGGGAG